MLKIKIGNKIIGSNEKTYIIAEAGSNHDKDINQAKKLIDIASEAGADAVKFQLFKAESFYSKDNPMFKIMKDNEFPREWLKELFNYASKKEITFLSTPFDIEAVDLLNELRVEAFKIASSETTNLSLLRYIAKKKKPMIVSTAMCNIADVYEAIEVIKSTGNNDIILLQCTALYPAEPKDVNLLVMDTLKNTFDLPVGYSDHTLGILMPPVAVAKGACIIEKHFTISRKLKGPDHSYAIEPEELKEMVNNIRDVEKSFGSKIKKMLDEEKTGARRDGIITKDNLKIGTIISYDNIIIKRPAIGIEPRLINSIIGQKVKVNIDKNTPLTWEMIE